MAWTYSATLATDKDKVRLYIGDIDRADHFITDEAITYLLTLEGSVIGASAGAAERIAAKFARQFNVALASGLSVTLSQQYKHYAELAARLRAQADTIAIAAAARVTGLPYAGGISESDIEDREADTDWVEPAFRIEREEHANPLLVAW